MCKRRANGLNEVTVGNTGLGECGSGDRSQSELRRERLGDPGGLLSFFFLTFFPPPRAFAFYCLRLGSGRVPPAEQRFPFAKPARPSVRLLGLGIAGGGASRCPKRAESAGKGSEADRGRGLGACLVLLAHPAGSARAGRRAQGARDEGSEPGAPLGPQGAVGLRRRGAGAALPGGTRPQPGWLGGGGGGGGGRALQGGRGGGRRAGAVPAVRYERLLQPPAEAGAHHPAQQESQQSGDPAARHRLHPGPAAGAGDAPGSAETAAAARAAAPPGRDLSRRRATADPAHRAQHRPGRRREQGRQHSVPLSRAVQVCGRLSPSQEP